MITERIVKAAVDILSERQRQKEIGMNDFDKTNTVNDYIAYICAYAGRAAEKVLRNEKEGLNSRDMLVKAGALCIAAIEKIDEQSGPL